MKNFAWGVATATLSLALCGAANAQEIIGVPGSQGRLDSPAGGGEQLAAPGGIPPIDRCTG